MNKNILWLPSWYPDKIKPYNGDFIQRHAKAAGIFHFIQVIYVVRDEDGKITNDSKVENSTSGNVNEKICYYYSPRFSLSIFNKLFSGLKRRKCYKKLITEFIRQNGKPDLVHVHVAMQAGLIARWIKRKYHIPYIISEHWTGYLPEAQDPFLNLPYYIRRAWKKVLENAGSFSVVSDYLGACIKKEFSNLKYRVIPNVVDTDIFSPAESNVRNTTRFIHISGLDYQKNPEDIIKAFAKLKEKNSDFLLTVVGPGHDKLKLLAKELDIESHLNFYFEMPQIELAELIRQSNALILYSRYETFGCVLIEANACGVPVIVSDLSVFKETIRENVNGIFVTGNNPDLLAKKLLWFINNRNQFNHSEIAGQAKQLYNYERVGKMFSDWYNEFTGKP